jgi:peptide deformylase
LKVALEIVNYPHPALRWKSNDVGRIDDALRETVREMFELMYEHKGIGLAANQVALPFRFFVANLTGEASEPDEELVFINPQIIKRRGTEVAEEGCLSLPGLYADVKRSEGVVVEAYDLDGQLFRAELTELGARAAQHEIDHLDGVLFIDRLDDAVRQEVASKIDAFAAEYERLQTNGEIPSDDELRARLQRLVAHNGVPANAG